MENQAEGDVTRSPREIHAYHCLCSQLVFTGTQPISSLKRRSGDGLDKAYILPLPRLPSENASDVEDGDGWHASEEKLEKSSQRECTDYALLLNTVVDRSPIVVRRTDGFETRYHQRCGRCKLIIGYQLTNSQYDGESAGGRREDVVYLLPGGLMATKDMAEGKKMEASIAFEALREDTAEV